MRFSGIIMDSKSTKLHLENFQNPALSGAMEGDGFHIKFHSEFPAAELPFSLVAWFMIASGPVLIHLDFPDAFLHFFQTHLALLLNEPLNKAGFWLFFASTSLALPFYLGGMLFTSRITSLKLNEAQLIVNLQGLLFVRRIIVIPAWLIKKINVGGINQGSRYDEGGILYINHRRYKLSLDPSSSTLLEQTLTRWLEQSQASSVKASDMPKQPMSMYLKLIGIYVFCLVLEFTLFGVALIQEEYRDHLYRQAVRVELLETLKQAPTIFEQGPEEQHEDAIDKMVQLGREADSTMRSLLQSPRLAARRAALSYIARSQSVESAMDHAGEFLDGLESKNATERKEATMNLLLVSPDSLFVILQLYHSKRPHLTLFAAQAILETSPRYESAALNHLQTLAKGSDPDLAKDAEKVLKEREPKK